MSPHKVIVVGARAIRRIETDKLLLPAQRHRLRNLPPGEVALNFGKAIEDGVEGVGGHREKPEAKDTGLVPDD